MTRPLLLQKKVDGNLEQIVHLVDSGKLESGL